MEGMGDGMAGKATTQGVIIQAIYHGVICQVRLY